MINKDFYPTPKNVIDEMLFGLDLFEKNVLEPSAGKGDIVNELNDRGANVDACEIEPELRKILTSICNIVGDDFLKLTKEDCSHYDYIIMNPPFSADEQHILHAYEVAPEGCEIIALCNYQTLDNTYSRSRKELLSIINNYGTKKNLGNVFQDAERSTNVEIGLIRINKPLLSNSDFSFYFEETDSDISSEVEGLMPYNAIREIVQRVTGAMKIYDEQVIQAVRMQETVGTFTSLKDIAFVMKNDEKEYNRETFRREIQKKAWSWVFNKLNMQKYMTAGVKENINKFIAEQKNIPFTMKNIYQMIDFIVQTFPNQIDKSIEEVFDRMTRYHDENRYNVEGWKTNSHYILNKKFIFPNIMTEYGNVGYGTNVDIIEDFMRVLCYMNGKNYDKMLSLKSRVTKDYHILKNGKIERFRNYEDAEKTGYKVLEPMQPNIWYDWEFFEIKFFKKGTMHFKFKDLDVWARFNQNVARIKGLVLPDKI